MALINGKRRFNEDNSTPTLEICKRFRPILISNPPTYISLTDKVNRLENKNTMLEEKIATLVKNIAALVKNTAALEDKYKEQNLLLKKYMDKSTELTKIVSDSKDLVQKMELLTDKCKAVLAENELLKTDIKYLEKACDKSADYYRMCFT
jgi:predicted RNase H-like nuclease (RuvC/YqgF family)